jgi:hypothetical protein
MSASLFLPAYRKTAIYDGQNRLVLTNRSPGSLFIVLWADRRVAAATGSSSIPGVDDNTERPHSSRR